MYNSKKTKEQLNNIEYNTNRKTDTSKNSKMSKYDIHAKFHCQQSTANFRTGT